MLTVDHRRTVASKSKPTRVILTADDFGSTLPVNEAVEQAHLYGILTSASLMVGAPATADAVQRAKNMPALRVGLHLVLSDGWPTSRSEIIPDLIDVNGYLPIGMIQAGFRFFFLQRVRRQLEIEIRAQFDSFRGLGLTLDHVNVHKHFHLHPTILDMLIRIGPDYGMRAIRLPYEPLRVTCRISTRHAIKNIAWSLFIAPWVALLRTKLASANIAHNDFLFGLSETGRMNEETLINIVNHLPHGINEIYFHPATSSLPAIKGSTRHDKELKALLSPSVRELFENLSIERIAYNDIA